MITITATNNKGADLMVSTTVEPTNVKEAVDMLPTIKSGLNKANKRNRVHAFVVTDTNTNRTLTFERNENGEPIMTSDNRPTVKRTNTSTNPVKVKAARRIRMMRDVYTNGSGKRLEIVITAGKGGGKVYEVRTFVPEIKHATKGHVIRAEIDTLRTVTRHELVNGIMPHFERNGFRFASRDTLPA